MERKFYIILTDSGRNLIKKQRKLIFGSQYSVIKTTGICQSSISDWEKGRYSPISTKFKKYVKYLKLGELFLKNDRFVRLAYFSPYKRLIDNSKKLVKLKYLHSSLDKKVILTPQGRKFLKKKRIQILGSQYIVSNFLDLDQSTISNWECNKSSPSYKELKSHLNLLDIKFEKFIKNKKYVKSIEEKHINRMIRIAAAFNKNKILRQMKLTTEKSYLLGVLGPGDGYVGYDELELGVTDKEFAMKFKSYLEKVYGIEPSLYFRKPVNPNHNPKYHVRLCSKAAVEDIKKYAKHFKEYNWQLPKAIRNASEKIKCAYLRGIFDSQAHVSVDKKEIRMYLSNLRGLYKLQKLLKSIGIKSSVTDHNQILRISGRGNLELFSRKINFVIIRKRKSLEYLLGGYKDGKTISKILNEELK